MNSPADAAVEVARLVAVDTPHGPFSALVEPGGAVLASGWTEDVAGLVALVHPTLRPEVVEAGDGRPEPVRDAVVAFHDGDPGPAAAVAVRQRGGAFTERVWALMRGIEAGAPVTYGELAARADRPRAVRAVGVACARNAATLFVPCHRVLGGGGRVTGFRWGVALATTLLEHEARAADARAVAGSG